MPEFFAALKMFLPSFQMATWYFIPVGKRPMLRKLHSANAHIYYIVYMYV